MYLKQRFEIEKLGPAFTLYVYHYVRLHGNRLSISCISREYQKYQLSVNWIRSEVYILLVKWSGNQLTNTDFSSPSLRNENIALVETMSQKRDEIYM